MLLLSKEMVWLNVTHFPWPLDDTCSKYTVTFGKNIPVRIKQKINFLYKEFRVTRLCKQHFEDLVNKVRLCEHEVLYILKYFTPLLYLIKVSESRKDIKIYRRWLHSQELHTYMSA